MVSFDNIHKKLYTHKIMNVLTFGFAIFFLLYAIMISLVKVVEQDEFNKLYLKLISEAEYFTSQVEAEHSQPSDDNTTEEVPQLFFNARQAVLTAWNNYLSYQSYEIFSTGKIVSNAAGQQVNIISEVAACQFENGNQYNSIIKFEMPGTNFGQTGAVEFYFANGNRYSRTSEIVNRSGSNLDASFSGNFVQDSNPATTKIGFYVVNNSTIMRELYFEPVYNPITKKLYRYYASVELNPNASTVNYRKSITEQGGLTNINFKSVKVHLIIDVEGNIISFRIEESYQGTKVIIVPIEVNISGEMNYTMISINKTPTMIEPNV